jgi:hypothetical protein
MVVPLGAQQAVYLVVSKAETRASLPAGRLVCLTALQWANPMASSSVAATVEMRVLQLAEN